MQDAAVYRPDRATGYRAERTSPIGLGGAIAVHAFAIGVIALMPAEMIQRIKSGTMITYAVPVVPVPPEQHAQKESTKEHPLQKHTEGDHVTLKPIVPLDDGKTLDGAGGTVTGEGSDNGGAIVADKPIAVPILVDATPDPRARRDFQPDYPPTMQRAQLEGKVTVRVTIGADGRVTAVEQIFATHDYFWEATRRQALRKWRFRPATRDDVPVETSRIMTVHFQLEK